jgi:GNAT superfamily N-acetyltransferase
VAVGHPPSVADLLLAPRRPFSRTPPRVTMVWDDERSALLGSASGFASPLGREVWLTGNVQVSRTARRQGIGVSLVSAVARTARGAGCLLAYCFIGEENLASFRVHERVGYAPLPVAQTQLRVMPAEVRTAAPSARVRLVPGDDPLELNAMIAAAGVGPFTALGPAGFALGPLSPVKTQSRFRRLIDKLRGHPEDQLFRVESDDGRPLGLLVASSVQHRLLLSRETPGLTEGLLAGIERAIRDVWSGIPTISQIAYYHHSAVKPPPELILASHHILALDCRTLADA